MSTYVDPPRRLLLGPGPSPVHPRVYEAMSRPITGIFDPYFSRVLEEHQDCLRRAFGTANRYTTAISGTGSAGMEACVSNLVEPGTKLAVFANGFFCDRISEMGRRYGATVVRLEKPWGEVFTDAEAAGFIDREKPNVVAFVNAETSTGALQKGKAICDAAHAAGAVVIADCVTSLGAMPVGLDATGIDAAYSCSQKGLGAPPGLAPLSFSERALERIRARKTVNPCWYLDANLLGDYLLASPRKYHVTIPVSLYYAIREALALIDEEGLENRWERHRRNHLAYVAGVEAMGLRMHVEAAHRLWSLNTTRVPEGIDDLKVRKHLMDDHGIEILGGFGALAGKVFRIGLMGSGSTAENVRIILDALSEALSKEGYRVAASVAG